MMKQMKKWSVLFVLVIVLGLTGAQSVLAFTDIQDDPAQAKIEALSEAGIVSGMDETTFAPRSQMTYAQGVHLIVKGLGLNIDNIRFFKKPEASDYFDHVADDAWYVPSLIIAVHNGLPLSRDFDPNAAITREQFAVYVYKAVLTKGSYALNKMYIVLADEADVAPDAMNAIQDLVKMNIVQLEDGKFRPQAAITRSEAAAQLYDAIQFIETHKALPSDGAAEQPATGDEVTVITTPINDAVNEVVLSRGMKPNPGYGIAVTSIDFSKPGEAVVHYRLSEPDPDKMYAQVMTEPQATTYIASALKVTLQQDQ